MVVPVTPLFGPVPGGMEMVVILLIAVLLFGANKIPKLARSTGEAMGEFKKGRQQIEEELNELEEDPAAAETSTDTSPIETEASDSSSAEAESAEPSD